MQFQTIVSTHPVFSTVVFRQEGALRGVQQTGPGACARAVFAFFFFFGNARTPTNVRAFGSCHTHGRSDIILTFAAYKIQSRMSSFRKQGVKKKVSPCSSAADTVSESTKAFLAKPSVPRKAKTRFIRVKRTKTLSSIEVSATLSPLRKSGPHGSASARTHVLHGVRCLRLNTVNSSAVFVRTK